MFGAAAGRGGQRQQAAPLAPWFSGAGGFAFTVRRPTPHGGAVGDTDVMRSNPGFHLLFLVPEAERPNCCLMLCFPVGVVGAHGARDDVAGAGSLGPLGPHFGLWRYVQVGELLLRSTSLMIAALHHPADRFQRQLIGSMGEIL